ITSPTMRSASGCGSNTFTSTPAMRKRAIQPPPMTPPPMQAALEIGARGVMGALIEFIPVSSPLHQLELLADLLGSNDPRAHARHDTRGFFNELRIGREFAFADVEVVFKPNADIAAGEHGGRGIGEGVAADGKGGEGPTCRHVVHHRHESVEVVRRAPPNAHAKLDQHRILDQLSGSELLSEPEVTGVE